MYQIFTSFNEKYHVLAAACIASLFEHASSEVEIKVLDTGIRKSTRKKFERWALKKNRSLTFIPISVDSYKATFANSIELPIDIEYYTRLLAPYFSAQPTGKIMYIDSDIICLRDIEEIFKVHLNGKVIGAVQDLFLRTMNNGIPNYAELGLNGNETYFNSGVMLIDQEKWKLMEVSRNVLLTSKANQESIIGWDQYALNIVLLDHWKELPKTWNEMIGAERNSTFFRHFAGPKPLIPSFSLSDADLFFAYHKQSPFFSCWYKRRRTRFALAKFLWKLKHYSNIIFNTSYNTSTLDI